jgi:hypothetical protein
VVDNQESTGSIIHIEDESTEYREQERNYQDVPKLRLNGRSESPLKSCAISEGSFQAKETLLLSAWLI